MERADCYSSSNQFKDKEHAMANVLLFIQLFLLHYSNEIIKKIAYDKLK
jgi:hypothetical protein